MTKPLEVKSNKVTKTYKNIIPLTFGEENGNAVSHGVAAFVTLCALPYAALQSYFAHGFLGSFSVSIYVISIFLMFLFQRYIIQCLIIRRTNLYLESLIIA